MEMYPREKKVEAQSRNLSYILITLKKNRNVLSIDLL